MVDREKAEWALGCFAPRKAPGVDEIFPLLLKEAASVAGRRITRLMQASLAWGYIPKAWRTVKVIFIPKPGRTTCAMAKSFRPICLSSFVLKTLERMVDRHIRLRLEEGRGLHANQHAYQPGKSTVSALHALVSRVERALDRGHYVLGLFFDIEGAFSNVSFEAIKEALHQYEVEDSIILWVMSMLRSMVAKATLAGVTSWRKVGRGTPQGGVLSPLLWSLVIDSLIRIIESQGIYMQAYADDGVVLVQGPCLMTLSALAQRALTMVHTWCEERGLAINPQKSELLVFTRRRSLKGLRIPSIGGIPVMVKEEVKYLGVILDRQLRWQKHVEDRIGKAKIALWQCNRVVGRTWGFTPKATRWVYEAVIRPMIVYAAAVWWPRVGVGQVKKKLDSIQRGACLAITGAMRTTPTAAMETILNLRPLDQWIKTEAAWSAYLLDRAGLWRRKGSQGSHENIIEVMGFPVWRMRSDYMAPTFRFRRKYEVTLPNRETWISWGPRFLGPTRLIFTDGSRSSATGSGVHVPDLDLGLEVPLGGLATVFQAEVRAILECCLHDEIWQDAARVTICSDSQAALRALMGPKFRSRLVYECVKALERRAESCQLSLVWVPGHCGVTGNEKADLLAKRAASEGAVGPEPFIGIPGCVARLELHRWGHRCHAREWESTPGCRQAKLFIGNPGQIRVDKLLRLGRTRVRMALGLLTGHIALNRHLFVMKRVANPDCPQCGKPETAWHLLAECAAYDASRFEHLGDSRLTEVRAKQLDVARAVRFAERTGRFEC